MEATFTTESIDFPPLNDIFSIEKVDVVQHVVAGDQLKQALDFIYSAVADLQRPERFSTPDDLEKLQQDLRTELAELKAARQATEEAAASQQEAVEAKLQALSEQQQELKSLAEDLQGKGNQLARENEINANRLAEVHDAVVAQRHAVVADIRKVHATVVADIKETQSSSQEAVRALVDDAAAIRQEVQEARTEALQQVSAVEQQVKENEESAAAQKLMDLQSADDIITTRMAAANVEGLARAVAALSRESARADATIRELQQAQVDLRAQLSSKAGVSELHVAVQRRPSKAGPPDSARGRPPTAEGSPAQGAGAVDGGYVDAQFALLHERITGKGDAEEVSQIQRDIAHLKRAIGANLLVQQLQQDGAGSASSLQDDMDKLLERVRKVESTLGAQEVVSAIMRRSASAKGVQAPPHASSLLSPSAQEEAAAVEAAAALSRFNDADLKSLDTQIRSLKAKLGNTDSELGAVKGLLTSLQGDVLRKADRDDVTSLRLLGRHRQPKVGSDNTGPNGTDDADKALDDGADDSSGPKALGDGASDSSGLLDQVLAAVAGLASQQELEALSQRLGAKADLFVVQALQEDVQELQEELDTAKRGMQQAALPPGARLSYTGAADDPSAKTDGSLAASNGAQPTPYNTQVLAGQPTPYNTLALSSAQPTPNNTLEGGAQGAGAPVAPSPRANLLEYVASVLSRRNTTEVSSTAGGAGGASTYAQRPSAAANDPVQAMLAGKLAPQASQYSVGGPQTGQLPSYEAIVAHQQALGQHVQRLTDELAKLRRSGSRRADGDHTLLSRKPLSGYICMACDRPLGKLSVHGLPAMPTKKMSTQVQMEYIPAHGVMDAEASQLRFRREAGTRNTASPPKSAIKQRDATLTPAIDLPRQDVGPTVGQGGWKSTHPYATNPAGSTLPSRPSTAIAGGRRG